jgi:hypothetical protein
VLLIQSASGNRAQQVELVRGAGTMPCYHRNRFVPMAKRLSLCDGRRSLGRLTLAQTYGSSPHVRGTLNITGD